MQPNQFGKFLLLKRLAVGGMAEIYLARQTGLQGFEKLVVVKKILPQLATEESFVNMFLDEARLAASLSHPNVVQIYDLGKEQGSYYIAMEFIAGHDLSSMVKKVRKDRGQIPVEIVARVIADAAAGLHYAHTLKDFRGNPLKLVHRDISPSNILVSYQGGVKVVDFGIAKAESQSSKTQAGTLKGKYSYMSPEQIRNMPLDGRSDVFALGITLYEVLVGRRLFKRESELAIINDILEGTAPPPSTIRPDVPPELDAIVARALEKDVKKRFESARELQLALEGWLARQLSQTTSASVGDFMEVTFAEELGAYQRLLAELPTATSEQLAALLAQGSASSEGSQSSSFSDPRIRGITADTAMPADPDEATGIVVTRPTPSWVKVLAVVGPALLLALGGVGYWLYQRGEVQTVVVKATEGTLDIKSDPPGAVIALNGKPTGKVTPARVAKLPFGTVEVKLELAGYQPRTLTETLSPDTPSRAVAVELTRQKAAPGSIKVETTPPGAKLFLDGKPLAAPSPTVISDVEAESEHLVRASKEGFLDEAQAVVVKSGQAAELKLALKARAPDEPPPGPTQPKRPARELVSVDLASNPPAEVMLEGKRVCRTPCAVKLPTGKATMTFVDPKIDLNVSRSVTVDKGNPRLGFEFKKGKLAAQVEPWADVYLGDKKLGTTPFAPKELYEGSYSLKLVNSEIGAMRNVRVQVEAGKTTVLREKLN